jgi:peptidoglycan/xylan/chitin deacetylase (PgdA/CDA1 family)/GT2 family glycosyltransferase
VRTLDNARSFDTVSDDKLTDWEFMAETTTSSGSEPALSVVVFGYRNESTILRAVASLVDQDSDDPFEVIVATSGGDRTATLVRDAHPGMKVIESSTRLLPGGVRNLGATLATGEIVTFLEADCVARPGWVRTRIALHRAGHDAVASALDTMSSDGLIATAALYLVHAGRLAGNPAGPAKDYQAYGLSFSRDLFERAGPFDEMLRSYEDTAMAERLQYLGVQSWFDPAICIEHDGPATLAEMLQDQFVRARRDSWVELVRLPAGRHRHRWELVPGVGAAIVVLRALYRLVRRARFTAQAVRQGHTGPGRRLPALVVPMVLGQIAYQLGWIADQLRNTRRGGDLGRDRLPSPSGLRRWVTTDGRRVAALTFDGIPPAAQQAKLLDVLGRTGVPAAFFVTGSDARSRSEDVAAIAASGHIVAGSGWSGTPFPSLSDQDLHDEIDKTNSLLAELVGRAVPQVRPPGGAYDRRVVSTLAAQGLEPWLWNTHPAPSPGGPTTENLAQQVMDDLTPGSVIALEVTTASRVEETAAALPAIIRGARRRGYEFVALTFDSAPDADDRPGAGDLPRRGSKTAL